MTGTSRGLRVLLATRLFFPHTGGVENYVYQIGRRLVCAGVEVTILTSAYSNQLPNTEEVDGIHIRRVKSWLDSGFFYFAPDIYSIVANGGWDVVHCQDVSTLFGLQVLLVSWYARSPYIVTLHGYPLLPPLGGSESFFTRWAIGFLLNVIRRVKWAILRPLFRRARRLIGVSRTAAERFQTQLHLPEELFAVISPGGDLPKVTTTPSQNTNGPVVVSPGRLERYKGHHRIIAALPLVCKYYPNVTLLILGAGPYEAALRRLARHIGVADRVQIKEIPAEDRSSMAQVLADASLVTQFTEYEAQSAITLEALSLGRSVLVADIPAFREFAEQGLVRAIPLESTVEEVASAVVHQLRKPLVPPQVTIPSWDDCAMNLLFLYRKLKG